MKAVIMTVGTSLLTNHGWKRGGPLPSPNQVIEWTVNPDRESAEMATWRDIEDVQRTVLVSTNSEDAKLCADALAALWPPAEVAVIESLGLTSSVDQYEAGLKEFSNILLREISRARGQGLEPVLAVTAGTKGQTAVAFLVGAVSSVDCLYRHEAHATNGCLPSLPIMWDQEFFSRTKGFWTALDDTADGPEAGHLSFEDKESLISEFDPKDRRVIASILIQTPQGWTTTAAGSLFLRHFLEEEADLIEGGEMMMSARALEQWTTLKEARQTDTMRRNAGRVWRLIAEGSPGFASKHGSDLLFYPTGNRRANSHVSICRLEDGQYGLCEFYFSHDDRDRDLKAGWAQAANYSHFQPVRITSQ